MPNPLDAINLIIDFIGSFADAMRDPEQRNQFAQVALMSMVAVAPIVAFSSGLRRYGKNRGRDLSAARNAWRQRDPFVEPRLNEAFAAIKRFMPLFGFLAIIGALILTSFIQIENVGIALGAVVGTLIGGGPRLFVEACLAFGAEVAPAPEVSPQTLAT